MLAEESKPIRYGGGIGIMEQKIGSGRLKRRHLLSQTQYIAYGFFILILIGTGLLMLPIANRSGESLGLIDALFTAPSASCLGRSLSSA